MLILIKCLLVLCCLLSLLGFTVHHIKKCIRKYKDRSLTIKRSILTLLLLVITCLSWFGFSQYIYPFDRTLTPVLVAELEVSEKYVLDNPEGRFWRGAYKGMWGESFWFDPNDTEHFGATMPQLDYKNHCYVITYGQKIETLSYNAWDIIDMTGAKAGYITYQEEFYPSSVFIYEIPKIRIDNDVNNTVTRNPRVSWGVAPYVDMETYVSGEMLKDRFGILYVQRHKYVLTEASGNTPAKVSTEGYIYDFTFGYIRDLTKSDISFCISNAAAPLTDDSVAIGVDPMDLRTADSSGCYQVGNIQYIYKASEGSGAVLQAIRWQANENAYEIQLQPRRTYDLEDGSFLAQLLREETAEKAVESFNTDISNELFWRNAWRGWLTGTILAVVLVSAAVLFFLLRRRQS